MNGHALRRQASVLADALWELIVQATQYPDLKEKFPRNMDFLVLYGLELPIIQLPRLTLQTAANYLCVLQGPCHQEEVNEERSLYGLLHIGPPCNTIFLQENLSPCTKNYVLSHEIAHFLADFFLVKELWNQAFPSQREAVQRFFAWETIEENLELRAAIKGLPSRPVTITARSGSRAPAITNREILADLVAREFLAPWSVVARKYSPDKARTIATLHESFGLPLKIAAYYHDDLARTLSPRPDTVDRLFASFVSPAKHNPG